MWRTSGESLTLDKGSDHSSVAFANAAYYYLLQQHDTTIQGYSMVFTDIDEH